MRTILLDTNALISFLTDRDAEQQEKVAALFDQAVRGETRLALHQTVISEVVYVLTNGYRVDPQEVANLLRDLITTPGLLLIDRLDWNDVLDRWPSPHPDLADACLASVGVQEKVDAIATFDRKMTNRLLADGIATPW